MIELAAKSACSQNEQPACEYKIVVFTTFENPKLADRFTKKKKNHSYHDTYSIQIPNLPKKSWRYSTYTAHRWKFDWKIAFAWIICVERKIPKYTDIERPTQVNILYRCTGYHRCSTYITLRNMKAFHLANTYMQNKPINRIWNIYNKVHDLLADVSSRGNAISIIKWLPDSTFNFWLPTFVHHLNHLLSNH